MYFQWKYLYVIFNDWMVFCRVLCYAKSLQSCPTLCDPIDGSPPGSAIPGSLQARTLEWVAMSFSNAWKWKVKVKSLSRVLLLVTPWTAAYQAPLSMGFSRQEYWSGVPLPSLLCDCAAIYLTNCQFFVHSTSTYWALMYSRGYLETRYMVINKTNIVW